ncbi:hypothetical protein D4764_09G0001360 [Takifugu flavidus]|uniref:Reverse transcriptase domain-containing protein n=1 Tax=Takifugu flavidus TaxID=433684 RepID=A0A5C6MNU8_9TELE|nr:hypothetical protein D4764_09G0001360 [Takifugu flavidus]
MAAAEGAEFAYRPGIGVDDAVIYLLHRSLSHLEGTGSTVRVMFFDFSSAFNTIQPSLLRGKMEGAGVDCHLAAWTTDYLTNRPHLQHGGTTGRVSEGNKLEYREVITNFVAWCELNQLRINTSKTKLVVINFGRKAPHTAPVNIQGLDIEIVEEYKYLGHYFYDSVVASVIFYAVVCWSCGSSERDRKRLNKLVRRAGSVLDCSLDSIDGVGERRMLAKLTSIMDTPSHPLHETVGALSSSFSSRLLHPRCKRERYRRLFNMHNS